MFYHKERHVATKYYMWWNHSIFYIHGSQILLIRYVIKSQYTWNFNCWSFSVRCWRICWWWREWCQQICWHNWWGKCCLWRWARMKGLLCRFPNTAHSTCAAVEKKKIIKKWEYMQVAPGQFVPFLVAHAGVAVQGCPLHYLNLHPQTCLDWSAKIIHHF